MAERAGAPLAPAMAMGQSGAAVRAEFYLCLARAFLAPTLDMHSALMRHLADDLEEMAREAAYPIEGTVASFRSAIASFPQPLELMRLYAALFLVPPAPVHINAGFYLDGAVMGDSVRAMEACYSRLGVVRSDRFRDTSDHVAVQLEFLSLLFCRQTQLTDVSFGQEKLPVTAQAFLDSFVCHWVKPFRADLEMATAGLDAQANPYLHLAEMIEKAVGVDVTASYPRVPRAMRAAAAGRWPVGR